MSVTGFIETEAWGPEVQGHPRLYLGQPGLYDTVSKNELN